jgi:FkbH-like protein
VSKTPHGGTGLDYFALVEEARRPPGAALDRTVRLAVVAEFSTPHLLPLLRALAARAGVLLEIYQADFDSIEAEILDASSGLHEFAPRYVAILPAAEKLKTRFYRAENRQDFAAEMVTRFTRLWAAMNPGVTIIQGNFVQPSERAFGHFELKVPESMGAVVAAVNAGLAAAARAANNVLLCDVDHIAAEIGRASWADEALWSLAKLPCRLDHLPLLAQAVVGIVLAAEGRMLKCLALDLDNTLWGGVIGDDGLAGIALGEFDEGEAFVAFQHFLKDLKNRGIILAVVSKNDMANARLPFQKHPHMVLREDDVAVFIANWDNKADNLRRLQATLNIGFDAIAFIDDNPFERDLVRQFLPDVVVPELPEDPALYIRALNAAHLFETASYSQADRERPEHYRVEAQRELAKVAFTNIEDYLASLGMKIAVERFTPFQVPRIVQLMQRSNQFNLTTQRLGAGAVAALMQDAKCLPLTVTLSDKFGDYGLISVVILRFSEAEVEIDTYLMSCRVLKRGVEQFVMNEIFNLAAARGARRVVGKYLKTAKNAMVENFYQNFGFQKDYEWSNGDSTWSLAPAAYAPRSVFMADSRVTF